MAKNLHIPIALNKENGKLVNVKDVPNGLGCNCYCAKCKENLIAVNKEIKQKAHFRHTDNSNCEFNNNYESYIHWLTKEIFKNINSISLPQIKSSDIRFDSIRFQELNKKIFNFLKTNGLHDEKLKHILLEPV